MSKSEGMNLLIVHIAGMKRGVSCHPPSVLTQKTRTTGNKFLLGRGDFFIIIIIIKCIPNLLIPFLSSADQVFILENIANGS
jgi:hypothetical protein